MINQPILIKPRPHAYDYKNMTWESFLILREKAKIVADAIGYPVYILGSILEKDTPRDIDVSVIMPLDKYEKMFGKLPDKQEDYPEYLDRVNQISYKYTRHLHFCIEYHLDIKVCPDTWWPEKTRMLLAEPKNNTTDKIKELSKLLIKDLTLYEIEQLKILLGIHLKDIHNKKVQNRW